MTATKTNLFRTDEEAFAFASEIAKDQATLSWHEGDDGCRAIRITGCYPEDAARLGDEIERRLFRGRDRETGLYPAEAGQVGFSCAAGFAAVWIR